MPSEIPTRSLFSKQVASSIFIGSGLATAAAIGFLAWSAARVDDSSLQRQVGFVSFALNEQAKNLPVQQSSSTIWDEAVVQSKLRNAAWISENLTEWMSTYFGHDRVFVLDDHDLPVQIASDGHVVSNDVFKRYWPTLQPLVDRLRAQMNAASAGLADSTAAITSMGVEDTILVDGVPSLVSAKPIVPSSDAVPQAPGTEYVHVAVQFIDQTMLDGIAEEFSLLDAHVTTTRQDGFWHASVPIEGAQGNPLGFATWTRYRPATALIVEGAPAGVAAILVGFGLIGFVLWRLRRSSIQLEASQAQTQFLAFHDSLTGLPNRALFEDRLERALTMARERRGKVALLCLDLDRFKAVNDAHGHQAGDELVRQVGARLSACLRDVDTVARLGGDEFAIIQVGVVDAGEAEELALRIAAAFQKSFDLAGEHSFVTASVGIAMSDASGTSREDILRKADTALYQAKTHGRARHEVFVEDMDDVLQHRRAIERDLRTALETGEGLSVAYQPVYADNGRKIVGAEALARWHHPTRGSLSPQLFIAVAEERGLIETLGEYVLRSSCEFTLKSGLPWVAVNVSPVQFRNERMVERIMDILWETGLEAPRLQLEITEGVLLDRPEKAARQIEDLRKNGIRVALDDFGTGYSSMTYLRRYGVDKLKIDRSFIQELGVSPEATAIVRAMVTLGRVLHMRVTAEGVETIEQRDHLTAIGCHELQGYLLSRPLQAEQLVSLLVDTKVAPAEKQTA